MQTQIDRAEKSPPPTLFARNRESKNSIIPVFEAVMEMDQSLDVVQILQRTAERTDCDFLFEIPGALFELPDHRAAVLKSAAEDSKHDHVFVLCGENKGITGILNFDEIPEQAQNFFYSYVSVLSCLSEISTVKSLH
ncbi:MAG: hypothetical protein ACR2O3_13885 [Rhizobiaceae bacterium]